MTSWFMRMGRSAPPRNSAPEEVEEAKLIATAVQDVAELDGEGALWRRRLRRRGSRDRCWHFLAETNYFTNAQRLIVAFTREYTWDIESKER